ncbi:aspartate/glutamate racemase family protein [Lentisalinibacter salinarum]|uniref:aspartate/glutamate racemase family protein n=1 Tax=Lentisalinibacter salinarum TaxID=2992239 RepID=UPI003863799F
MEKLAILGTGDTPSPDEATPEPITGAARRFHPELRAVPGAVFPRNPGAREISAHAYLQAGLEAEREGYAGLYINTVGDYGIAELREAANIPVTGAGEGAIRTAQAGARRFAIVTIWPPSLRFVYDAALAATNAREDCVAIRHLSGDADLATLGQADNFVQEMQACGMTSMAKIRAVCMRALEQDGADVIVLGCTCMHPVAELLEADGLSIIEPMAAGYRHLESLVSARSSERPTDRAAGHAPSPGASR